MSVTRLNISPYGVILHNDTIRARCNKILIKNSSNYKVFLFRIYTLSPGEVFEMGAEDNSAVLDVDMNVTFDSQIFDAAQADIKRVEVLLMHKIGADYSFLETPSKEFPITMNPSTAPN